MRLHHPFSVLELLLIAITPVSSKLLQARSAGPQPISISPSQNWDGYDGPWSSFTIQLGTPIQNVRVFISSAFAATWVVSDGGCVASQASCNEDRGRTFSTAASSTWKQGGQYALGSFPEIGSGLNGTLGHENYTLGLQGSGGPSLPYQAVVAYTSTNLYQGMFGTNALANTTGGNPHDFITSLKNQSRIPSASFGYTAGNQYRLKKVYGSLTLGGYDASLITPNSLKIPFAGDDPSRYLQIAVHKITSKDQGGKTADLLTDPIMANVDSTESMIWLPEDVCKAFETSFSLTWDDKTKLYLVSDDLHSKLIQQNASVTFQVSNQTTGGGGADITLPYASFDLLVKPPYPGINSSQRYFPLKRTTDKSQYTLGRTLLQEAYLTVDWDRRQFSLQQCNYTTNVANPKLVPIYTPGEEPQIPMSTGAKAGIGVGVAVVLLAIVGLTAWLLWRRRRARRQLAEELAKSGINPKEGMIRQGHAKGEMGAGIDNALYEMEGSDGNALKPYGGNTPPWVDEKARYPRLGFAPGSSFAEIDGVASRAELGGAVGFYGGRGVHEMYDPSSVRPIELPTSSSEAPTPLLKASKPADTSAKPLPRGPMSAGKPSPSHSTLFSIFSRKSRDVSNAGRSSSSGISGPSTYPSPKQAEQAIGTHGQTNLVSIHKAPQGRMIPTSDAVDEQPPPVPPRDYETLPPSRARSFNTISSVSTKYRDSNLESNRERSRGPSRTRVIDEHHETSQPGPPPQRSDTGSSSRPSLPPISMNPDEVGRRQAREASPSDGSSGTRSGSQMFSPLSRQGTTNLWSPVSPDNNGEGRQFGRFSRL